MDHYWTEADAIAQTNRARRIAYSYDEAGNLLTVADDSVQAGALYTAVSPGAGEPYDALNRLRKLEIALPGLGVKSLAYSYDRYGNRSGLSFEDGAESFEHVYTYDDPAQDLRNRLQTARLPGMGVSEAYEFGYLDNDDLDTIARPSGVETAYAYLTHGPLDTIAVTDAGAATLELLSYPARDAVDRIETLTETYGGADHSYDYDPGGRLVSASYPAGLGLPTTPEAFEYGKLGNRELVGDPSAYAYNANDELTTSPFDPVLCYDADGNLASKRNGGDCATGPVTETFSYNKVNRLEQWTDGADTVDFLYDPFGRRIKKRVDDGEEVDTTWYLWDGDQLLAEYDGSDVRLARYAYVAGFAPVQFALPDGGGGEDTYDVHTDHLDTARMLTDENETVVWRAAYEAFGKAYPDEDPDGDLTNVTFNIRFPGQYFDAETGLHYNRFRYYDPAVGRYVSADPIGQHGGTNLFAYVNNNPLDFIDPTGTVKIKGVTSDPIYVHPNDADPFPVDLMATSEARIQRTRSMPTLGISIISVSGDVGERSPPVAASRLPKDPHPSMTGDVVKS